MPNRNVRISLFWLVCRNSTGFGTDLRHASETTFRFQTFLADRSLVGVRRWECLITLFCIVACVLQPRVFGDGSMQGCRREIKGSSKQHKQELTRYTYPPFGYGLWLQEWLHTQSPRPLVASWSIIGNGQLVKKNRSKTLTLAPEFLNFPRPPKKAEFALLNPLW